MVHVDVDVQHTVCTSVCVCVCVKGNLRVDMLDMQFRHAAATNLYASTAFVLGAIRSHPSPRVALQQLQDRQHQVIHVAEAGGLCVVSMSKKVCSHL